MICSFDSKKQCSEDCNIDTTKNLCDNCVHEYPNCCPENIKFGNGIGNDNIKCCSDYQNK